MNWNIFGLFLFVIFKGCFPVASSESLDRFEVWENIQESARNNDTAFLLDISMDTLDCIECNKGESRIAKEDFYSRNNLYFYTCNTMKIIRRVLNIFSLSLICLIVM